MPKTTARPKSRRKPRRKTSRARAALVVLGALLGLFVLIQFVPYGRDHTNPPETAPFKWTSSQAQAIAERACYDCHSNQTKWWWAVDIAPFSWFAQHDITAGRARLNFSDWNGSLSAQELQRVVNGNMPPLSFTLVHVNARLSATEKQLLVAGFEQSLAAQQGSSQTAAAPSASPSAAPTSPGTGMTALIDARCGTCHSSAPAQQFRTSSTAQAKGLIEAMIQQGAAVSPSEEQALITYYTR